MNSIQRYVQTGQFSEDLFQRIQRILLGVARRLPTQIMQIYGDPSDPPEAFREHVRDFIQDVFTVLLEDRGEGNVLEQYAQEGRDDAHIEHGIQAIALSAIKRHPKVRRTLDERIYRALQEILSSEPFAEIRSDEGRLLGWGLAKWEDEKAFDWTGPDPAEVIRSLGRRLRGGRVHREELRSLVVRLFKEIHRPLSIRTLARLVQGVAEPIEKPAPSAKRGISPWDGVEIEEAVEEALERFTDRQIQIYKYRSLCRWEDEAILKAIGRKKSTLYNEFEAIRDILHRALEGLDDQALEVAYDRLDQKVLKRLPCETDEVCRGCDFFQDRDWKIWAFGHSIKVRMGGCLREGVGVDQ